MGYILKLRDDTLRVTFYVARYGGLTFLASKRKIKQLRLVGRLPNLFAAASALALGVIAAAAQSPHEKGGFAPSKVVDQYCIFCHSKELKTAGVVLEGLDFSKIGANAPSLERVVRKVRTGEMPPAGMPRPSAALAATFTNWLVDALDRGAAAHLNPGRPAIHRLNRAEYSNAVRDLLALDIHPGDLLPVDDSGYGFDNVGAVLSVSPTLLERYLSVSRLVSRLAVGNPAAKAEEEDFTPAETRRVGGARKQRNERASDDLPFDSSGGMAFSYYFPLDVEYLLRVKLGGRDEDDTSPPPRYEVRVPIKAGLRTVGVTYLRESAEPEMQPLPSRDPSASTSPPIPPLPAEMDVRLDGVRLKRFEVPHKGNLPPRVNDILVAGPYNSTGRGQTPSRARLFVCRPVAAKDEEPCARKILATLSRRAFRRPVTDADIGPLLTFYHAGRREGDFDQGIEKALRAILVSPDFLFRIERDPTGRPPGTAYRLSDLELASRLSFFLWSSIPDDPLLALAEQGRLHGPSLMHQQVRRMLDDPRSQAFVSNFAGQWLYLRNLALSKPDPDVFPEFDEALRQSFLQETDLFFQSLLREDRSVLDLLGANYTYLNQRLAEHYGIPNIYGSQFRRVNLTDPNRGGLLGQGSILTVTSYPNRTSVVQRGKWILETLLGTPPPPPPPNVPALQPHNNDGKLLTSREQMEQHRSNAVCASCHGRMDPLGFALENYDGVGKWRAKDAGAVIDPSGKLPDGTQFTGPAGLKQALLNGHRDEYVQTVTEKLLMYALGRGLEYYDKPAVRAIVREASRDNYRLSSLITAIVTSTPFQMRRTSENDDHQEIVAAPHISAQPRHHAGASAARRNGAGALGS
jgi:mono/diheme cytochrome c family protein